jgi:hypothetical protein
MLERGDLLLVPFPFSDLSAPKRRPILVLTAADEYGDINEDRALATQANALAIPLAP